TFNLRGELDGLRVFDETTKRVKDFSGGNQELTPQLEQDMELVSSVLNAFLSKMIIVSTLFLAIILMVAGFIKGSVWCKILKEKLNRAVWVKFSLLILVWILLEVILLLIIAFTLKFSSNVIQNVVIVEFILFIYFSVIVFPLFFRSKKVFKAIKEAFYLGIFKFYLLIPSLLAMWIVLLILSPVIIVSSQRPSLLFLALAFILYSVYLSWTKFYISLVIDKIR
ncbi:MAG: hypothetical protein U9O94_01790, partial [Nanoarchaeota archaeon]|nr:hypothetical protein [Nanoarchaeota archaeon]